VQTYLVTGATGFVGTALCNRLRESSVSVKATFRDSVIVPRFPSGIIPVPIGPIGSKSQLTEAFRGVDIVIHLAGRVHVMNKGAIDAIAEFRDVNVVGTETIARQAAAAGVQRFVYVSSIKVNGDSTPQNVSFTEADPHRPRDPYGISKAEGELALHRVMRETGMDVVIVRPPLVYGAGVKGNFLTMLKVLCRGMPLPFGKISNRRSMVYLENLVDALVLCSQQPEAAGETYLVCDGEDISTPELLRKLGEALDRPVHLFPVHGSVLRLAAAMIGQTCAFERLLGSLTVDSRKIRRELGWAPQYSLNDGLRKTAAWYVGNHG
jgi:nucleoside-diphosphate-sugar epimerase